MDVRQLSFRLLQVYIRVVQLGNISAAARALLCGDAGALNRLLGGRARMVCNVVLPENDEPQREDDTDGDGDSELPETNLKAA